jgi:hypothetical protein
MDFFRCCGGRDPEPRIVETSRNTSKPFDRDSVRRGMVQTFSVQTASSSSEQKNALPAARYGAAPASQASLCGIGIAFQAGNRVNGEGGLIVASLVVDGPADRSGQVHVGDILESIDDRDIRQLNPENLSSLILGPPGSKVFLGFSSPDSSRRTVQLTRGWTLKSSVSNEQWSNPLPQNHSIVQSIPPLSPQ